MALIAYSEHGHPCLMHVWGSRKLSPRHCRYVSSIQDGCSWACCASSHRVVGLTVACTAYWLDLISGYPYPP